MTLNLALIGLNHKTAELDTRERASFHPEKLPEALRELVERPGIQETMIFSTCNRVELLSRVKNSAQGLESMEAFLREKSCIDGEQLREKLYRYSEQQAVRHVFRVASSLDSMILGEPQILGQVKSFYNVAVQAGTIGTYLNGLLQAAFHAAKRVRRETSIGEYSVSVSSAAVELARKIFGDLRGMSILIVGAGKMGKLAATHLRATGVRSVRVANRSPQAARELAAHFHGEAVPFEELTKWAARSEIVITSTGSYELLVDYARAQQIMQERKNTPIVFIDISVPRNVDPNVGTIDNVFYYDVDDLGAVVEANLQERRKEAALAEKIVEQEVDSFCARLHSLDMAPVVVELQTRIQEICQVELDRFFKKAGPGDPQERRELEVMISRIAGKIAHPLITQLRSTDHDPLQQAAYLDTLKRIFKLQKDSES